MDTPHEDSAAAAPGWRAALPAILAIFVVSRLLLLLVIVLVEATFPTPGGGAAPSYDGRPILGSLTSFDAVYYLGIAGEGYHVEPVVKDQFPDWVFFPLYPIAVRVVAFVVPDLAIAGVLVSNAALLVGLVLVYALSARHLGRDRALVATGLVAFSPGAVAFGMAYSDSLFLALAAGAVLAGERRRWLLMGIAYGLLVLCRPAGVLMALPLGVLAYRAGPRDLRAWLPLALGPLALVGFMAYQGAVLGDPLAFVHAQRLWELPGAGEAPPPGWVSGAGTTLPISVLLFAALLGAVGLVPLLRFDRIPSHHVLVAIVAIASVFVAGRIQSDVRYLAVAWPLAWALTRWRGFGGRDLLPLAWGGLYVTFAFLHVTRTLAP